MSCATVGVARLGASTTRTRGSAGPAVGRGSSRRHYGPPKIDGMTQTAFDMTSPLRSRWDQEGAEFVQSNK